MSDMAYKSPADITSSLDRRHLTRFVMLSHNKDHLFTEDKSRETDELMLVHFLDRFIFCQLVVMHK